MWLGLDWWIWLLIALGVVVITWLKLKVFASITKKKEKPKREELDD